ncbi:hypothetical protein [Streptomyces niger]|uniref:hypothetical protein n=1 Tax=Streptomyces niger TaxID=66373 RepID=UPI00069B9B2C|nr:hypothetical protein [Streptomyces niger]
MAHLQEEAEVQDQPTGPDLSYGSDLWGYLSLVEGRNAARMDTVPNEPELFARQANLGGFDNAQMSEWPLRTKNGLCLLADQGNVVRAETSRFIAGDRDSYTSPPHQNEFTVTMWKPA